MSGEMLAAQGFPLTLSPSKAERKALFNGLLDAQHVFHHSAALRIKPAAKLEIATEPFHPRSRSGRGSPRSPDRKS
jgi:hypothetical protein